MNTEPHDKGALVAFAVTAALLLTLALVAFSLDEIARARLLEEGGWVESASVFGYAVCILFVVWKGRISYLMRHHYFFLLPVFCMLRELDFHGKFTTMGIFKKRFYLSSEVPLIEKLFGTVVVGILLYIAFMIIYHHFKPFWRGLKQYSSVSLGALIAVILTVASKGLDGVRRQLERLGIEISDAATTNLAALEELLELGIPIVMLITFHAFFKQAGTPQAGGARD